MRLGDLQRLRTLTLVLDLGSISGAADVLGYTQSAVSQQLAALEREAGAAFVDRSKRPLRPTPAGEALRPHAERVLAAAAAAETALDDALGGTSRLRLAAFPSALSSFVPAAIRDLRRTHAGVAVQVLQLETADAVAALRAGEVAIAVVHHIPGAPVPDTAGLARRDLLTDHLHVVVPEGHRLARRKEISLRDLDGEPLVLPRRGPGAGLFRSLVEQLCSQAGFEPSVAYELDDLPAVQRFVAAGIAVVPMHGLTLATVPAGAVASPLVERPLGSRRVEALAADGVIDPAAEDLLDRLAAAASRPRAR